MSNYVVFTYQFSPIIIEEPLLFEDEIDPFHSMYYKNQFFDQILSDKDLIISYRNSRFQHRILYSEDGIYVFRLANRKYICIEENFLQNKIEDHPSVLIIIDNRKDKQRILIEERAGAFYDVEYVARILQNAFRSRLLSKKLSISILKEYHSKEFWDLVSSFKSGVEKIRFSFPYPNLSRIKDNLKEVISVVSVSTNSKNTKFELTAAPGETLCISKEDDGVNGLVEASAGSGQNIIVKARDFRYQLEVGSKTKKLISIEDFEGQIPEMAMARIIKSLDDID